MTFRSHLIGVALLVLSPAGAPAQGRALPDSLIVLERHPAANVAQLASEPPISQCALRLRNEASGTEFQLRKSDEVLVDSQTRRYHSTGYYRVSRPGLFKMAEDEVLKVDCDTHTAIAILKPGA